MTTTTSVWTLEIRFPSDHGKACELIDQVIEQLVQRGWPQSDRFAIQMGLEEALTNAIKHGNQNNPRKFITLEVQVDPQEIRIGVADEGPGFPHARVRDPTRKSNRKRESGRGVALIRFFMDEVHYNESGNQLEMVKRRSVS
jgi:serine/threonine-protein kinase RsbW